MSQLYHFLALFEFVPLTFFAMCLLIDYSKPWNFYVRVLLSLSLVILNIVQFIIEIMLEYNYNCWLSAMMIFMWGSNVLIYWLTLKKRILNINNFLQILQNKTK